VSHRPTIAGASGEQQFGDVRGQTDDAFCRSGERDPLAAVVDDFQGSSPRVVCGERAE